MAHETHDHQETEKTYLKVFIALLVLLVMTLVVSWIPVGPTVGLALAMAVAATKAALILLFFMHVRESTPLIQVFSIAGFFWLAMLIIIAMADYFTRDWMQM